MKIDELIAIDVHTHAEVSCRQPHDEVWQPYDQAASKYFKVGKRPTIAETIAYYRERKIGLVMFTVDSEAQIGARRIANEEVADAARENADIMIAFASIDPHKGRMGLREARALIAGVLHRRSEGQEIRKPIRKLNSPDLLVSCSVRHAYPLRYGFPITLTTTRLRLCPSNSA